MVIVAISRLEQSSRQSIFSFRFRGSGILLAGRMIKYTFFNAVKNFLQENVAEYFRVYMRSGIVRNFRLFILSYH